MSEKITFKELVELIAKQSKQSESSANSFIHELVQIIEGGLKQSGIVSISGFGKFELRWMKERSGVNPQTGEDITIPGQNKVVFKPFKALRETVNKPFANLDSKVLDESPESNTEEPEETDDENTDESDPFGLGGVFGSGDPFEEEDPFDSDDSYDLDEPLFEDDVDDEPFEVDEPSPSQEEKKREDESIDDLIFERENPHFGKKETESKKIQEKETDTAVIEREEKKEKKPTPAPKREEKPAPKQEKKPVPEKQVASVLKDESKMAEEVQKKGTFKWSYAAAVIIVMIALIILFLMMQRGDDSLEQTASSNAGDQTEQVIEAPSSADQETEQDAAAQEPDQTVEEESPPPSSGSPPPGEVETETYTVQSGQSLWNIAESQLGNPYLWPVIYHLNQDVLENPNQLLANADIEIPTFSDPDNLSEFEREQVALGYFSLYQWSRDNNPDEARYFLWAVGVFSQDLLDQPPSEVDSQDLAFARNR